MRLWGNGVVERGRTLGGAMSGRRFVARTGQFIASRIDARNGAMGLVPASLNGALVTNDFPLFDLNGERVLPEFLGWLCRTAGFVELCLKASEGTTNRVHLKEERFLPREISLPPLAEQQRVVARIEALAAQIREARTLRQESAEEATALFITTSRKVIDRPDGDKWERMRVVDACETLIDYRGRTPPISEEGIPHITSANIKDGRINWKTAKFVTDITYNEFMTRGIPKAQDVLFTMEAPLGEVGAVPDARKFSLAQRVILLRPKPQLLIGDFMARALSSPSVREDIRSKTTATTVAGIASKRLKDVVIPIPPLPDQQRIIAEFAALQEEVDALKRHQAETNAELEALLPAVLDRAFKGAL